MPELSENKKIFSLREVSLSIQKILRERYTSDFWVKAEMNKLNFYHHSGHCYPDLVEKHEGKVIAQMRSTLWKEDYRRINNKFLQILKEPLKDGIKILFLARITYDPVHGLSLWILDIDPGYTLGDIEKEKQETISRLQSEGIFRSNKLLPFPVLPQRIAIISVESSKGYADFTQVIDTNPWSYKFFYYLFPSLLQGDNASQSIITQLRRIRKVTQHFDVVAIIRGGGGEVGLSCYNDYALAREIALFPIPVITGIGHATNETVSEMISFTNAITPTKLAEFLLQKFHDFSVPVHDAQKKIIERSKRCLLEERERFIAEIKFFRSAAEKYQTRSKTGLNKFTTSLISYGKFFLATKKQGLNLSVNSLRKDSLSRLNQSSHEFGLFSKNVTEQTKVRFRTSALALSNLERNVENMSPAKVLKRGFSITYLNEHSIKEISTVKAGDTLKTIMFDGSIFSLVASTKSTNDE